MLTSCRSGRFTSPKSRAWRHPLRSRRTSLASNHTSSLSALLAWLRCGTDREPLPELARGRTRRWLGGRVTTRPWKLPKFERFGPGFEFSRPKPSNVRPIRRDRHDATALQISQDRDVTVPPPDSLLINTQVGLPPAKTASHCPLHDATGFIPRDPQHVAGTLHGLAGQDRGDGSLLEGHREPTAGLRERQGHAQHPMFRAARSRHGDMQEGLGLPHVQVTDHPLIAVVLDQTGLAAGGARKLAGVVIKVTWASSLATSTLVRERYHGARGRSRSVKSSVTAMGGVCMRCNHSHCDSGRAILMSPRAAQTRGDIPV